MARPLVVVGAGGFGRELLDVAEAMELADPGTWTVLGVLDDQPSLVNAQRLRDRGIPLLGPLEWLGEATAGTCVAIGIGQPAQRKRLAHRMETWPVEMVTLVHPSASLGSECHLGAGTVVCAHASVGTNVRLGRMVHLNPHAVVGHDTRIDDFVSVNPNATISGDCSIGAGVLVGAGAVILQGLTIGSSATIGAAACVTRAIDAHVLVKGVPARAWTSTEVSYG